MFDKIQIGARRDVRRSSRTIGRDELWYGLSTRLVRIVLFSRKDRVLLRRIAATLTYPDIDPHHRPVNIDAVIQELWLG